MKNGITQSRDFSPSNDNPNGRWDALYLILLSKLRGPASALTIADFDSLQEVLPPNRWTELKKLSQTSTSESQVEAAIQHSLRLSEPSAPVLAGIQQLARLALDREVEKLRQEIATSEGRIAAIETSRKQEATPRKR